MTRIFSWVVGNALIRPRLYPDCDKLWQDVRSRFPQMLCLFLAVSLKISGSAFAQGTRPPAFSSDQSYVEKLIALEAKIERLVGKTDSQSVDLTKMDADIAANREQARGLQSQRAEIIAKLIALSPTGPMSTNSEEHFLRTALSENSQVSSFYERQDEALATSRAALARNHSETLLQLSDAISQRNAQIADSLKIVPPFVKEVKVWKGRDREKLVYHQLWEMPQSEDLTEEKAEILRQIEDKKKTISAYKGMVAHATARLREKDKAFADVTRKYQELNHSYGDWLIIEAVLKSAIDIGDFAVSVGWPPGGISVLFELVWRGGEFANWMIGEPGSSGDYDFPVLPPELISQQIAFSRVPDPQETLHLARLSSVKASLSLETSMFEGMDELKTNLMKTATYKGTGVQDSFKGELLKSLVSAPYLPAAEAALLRGFASSNGWWAVAEGQRLGLYQKYGGTVFNDLASLNEHLGFNNVQLDSSNLKTILGSQSFWKNAVGGIVKSLGYSVVSGAGSNALEEHRLDKFMEMALFELDWFVARHELRSAGAFLHQQRLTLIEEKAKLGEFYEYLYKNFEQERVKNDLVDLELSTHDAALFCGYEIEIKLVAPTGLLKVSGPNARHSKYWLSDHMKGRQIFYSSKENYCLHYLLPVEDVGTGRIPIKVQAFSALDQQLDTNPATVVTFDVANKKWDNYEPGIDSTNFALNFVSPELEVGQINRARNNCAISELDVAFRVANSFSNEAKLRIFLGESEVDGSVYQPVPLASSPEDDSDSLVLSLSLEPDQYELRIDDGLGRIAATTTFEIEAKPPKVLTATYQSKSAETKVHCRSSED